MSQKPKVLISDKMSPEAAKIFEERGCEVHEKTGLSPDELKAIIGEYEGLAIRSSTKVTPEILEAATNLKVIGRAGIGVDNVDIPAASERGVVVMNTPFGNSITTAEHAIAMLLALARQIPQANARTQNGEWPKSDYMGIELTGKTLGLIGAGNIGSIVASRAQGLRMKVIAYDPFLTEERAVDMGVEKVELDELLKRADCITLHTPLTDETRNILSGENLAKTKKGVRIVNCARGGLIDEAALVEALDSGHVAGAALDVFQTEPAKESPLFGKPGFICTPHLGASTREAQENVALQVAEQLSDFLLTGAVTNALNMPSLSAEEELEGDAAELNPKPITAAVLAGLMRRFSQSVNMVNAPFLAKDRGIEVREIRSTREGTYQTLIRVTVETDAGKRSVAGTLFGREAPRLVEIFGIGIEAELDGHMIYVVNDDAPGFIGRIGSLLGNRGINIGTFNLGRKQAGGEAVLLLSLDQPVDDALIAEAEALEGVRTVTPLSF